MGRKTPGLGTPAVAEFAGEDPTPTPIPGTISNEDLAIRIRDVDKKREVFETSTTQRLERVEERTERVPHVEKKVDKLLLMALDKANKQEIASIDVATAHVQMQTVKEKAQVEDKAHAAKTRRERNLELVKMAGRVVALLSSGGFLLYVIEHC